MAAVFTINQEGLDEGLPNTAREDGLDTGDLVTLLSTAHESTYEFDLLWVGIHPTPDTTSRASLQPAGAGAVSFSPTAGVYGSWRIELVTDRGTPSEDRAEVIFAIKQSPTAIRIPAANERSDPEASLQKNGATYLARSSFNAPDGVTDSPFETGTYVSHYRAVADLIYAYNAGGGGGGGGGAPATAPFVMATSFDAGTFLNAYRILGGFCVDLELNELAELLVHARSPGATARVYWQTSDDVPPGPNVLTNTFGDPPTILPGSQVRAIHEYSALQIDVYAAQTFVGMEIPELGDFGDTHTIEILNTSSVNVTFTHDAVQPPDGLTAPFEISGAADLVLLPYKRCSACWDNGSSVWVLLT